MSELEIPLYDFVETAVFATQLDHHASLETLFAIQADLLLDPTRWPVVKGTGGARKGRIADPDSSHGKSGGFRYLYLFLEHRGYIYLLYLFAKNEQANLTDEQKKKIAKWVEAIKAE